MARRWSRGAALAGGLLLAAVALLAAKSSTELPCAGQCHAPFELDLTFRLGTSLAAGLAALKSCEANPTVVRIGRVHRSPGAGPPKERPLSAAIFTRSMSGPRPTHLVECLRASPAVISVGFPG